MAKAKSPNKHQQVMPKAPPQAPSQSKPPDNSAVPAMDGSPQDNASMYGGSGPARTSHREVIQLPVGFELPNGQLTKEAEVRAVTEAGRIVHWNVSTIQSKPQ